MTDTFLTIPFESASCTTSAYEVNIRIQKRVSPGGSSVRKHRRVA
jgi:hypothetical protein